jgi:HMG (high mobility group) box
MKTDNDDNEKTEHVHILDTAAMLLQMPVMEKSVMKKAKKKHATTTRKAPTAPKRFKSSYICFFMAKQPKIKQELGAEATVTSISKRSAEMWKSLSLEERAVWDEAAAQDKRRYMMEKSQYNGPWQVPWKRVKKDPSAPKRPMSAFLYFSQGKRSVIKQEKPEIKNTEVSRVLGEMWRNLTDEERAPHVDRERREREIYKIVIAEWRERNESMKQFDERIDSGNEIVVEGHDIHMDHLGNPYAVPNNHLICKFYRFCSLKDLIN